jgi:hypothetical protein
VSSKRRFPWSVLEIDATDDKKTVLKAYAVKLKVTRPEDDPSGFQELVEARNDALSLIKHGASLETFEDETPEAVAVSDIKFDFEKPDDSGDEDRSEAENESVLDGATKVENEVSKITGAIENILNNAVTFIDENETAAVLNQISDLNIADKNVLEVEVIYVLSDYIDKLWAEIQVGNTQNARSKRVFIQALNEEFQWTSDDTLLRQLSYDSSGEFVDRMRSIISGRPISAAEIPPRPWWQSGMSWWFLLMILAALARCVNNSNETLPPFQFDDPTSKKPALIEL